VVNISSSGEATAIVEVLTVQFVPQFGTVPAVITEPGLIVAVAAAPHPPQEMVTVGAALYPPPPYVRATPVTVIVVLPIPPVPLPPVNVTEGSDVYPVPPDDTEAASMPAVAVNVAPPGTDAVGIDV
jgi:hypothetical protein